MVANRKEQEKKQKHSRQSGKQTRCPLRPVADAEQGSVVCGEAQHNELAVLCNAYDK